MTNPCQSLPDPCLSLVLNAYVLQLYFVIMCDASNHVALAGKVNYYETKCGENQNEI